MVPFGLGIFLGVINKNKWKAFSMWTLVQPTEFQPHLATDSFMIWGKSLHLSASQFSFWQSQGVDGPWRFQNWGERHGLWWSHCCSESKISHSYFKSIVTSLRFPSLFITLSCICLLHLWLTMLAKPSLPHTGTTVMASLLFLSPLPSS